MYSSLYSFLRLALVVGWALWEWDLEPILQEGGWATVPVWTSAGNLAPTGKRLPDRPARSKSLYRLRYLGPHEGNKQTRKRIKERNIEGRKKERKGKEYWNEHGEAKRLPTVILLWAREEICFMFCWFKITYFRILLA